MDDRTLQIVLKARDEASATMQGVAKQAGGMSEFISKSFKNAAVVSASLGVAIGAIAKKGIESAAQFEQYQIAYTTLLKDQQLAADTIKQIQVDAAKTPFELAPLVAANQRLLSAGVSAKQAREDIINLGNAISATGGGNAELERLSTNLQQIKAVGKASALDIKQFAFAGINVYEMLAKSTGKTVEQVREMDISYDVLAESFKKASAAGGMFEGAMEAQSKSMNGLMSTLRDVVNLGLKDIFMDTGVFDAIRSGIEGAIPSIENFTKTITDFVTNNQQAVMIIAGAFGGVLSISVLAAAAAMATFVGISLPVIAIGAAIGAMAVLIATNWSTIAPILQPAIDAVSNLFKQIGDGIMTFVTVNMPVFQAIWDVFKNMLEYGLKFLSGLWNAVWPSMLQTFQGVWQMIVGAFKVLWGAFEVILSIGLGLMTGNWSKAWEMMKKGFMDIFDGIKTFAKGWWDSIVGMFKNGLNTIVGTLNGFINVINKAGGGVGVNIPNIPSFDVGGYVQNTGLAMVHSGEFVLSRDMLMGRQNIPGEIGNTLNQPITIEAVINTPLDLEALGFELAWQLRNA